jgi:hypothetical protein
VNRILTQDRLRDRGSEQDKRQIRARRLLLAYPRTWRVRYGEEFLELLLSDMDDRPSSLKRIVSVGRAGTLARLSDAGFQSSGLPSAERSRASLASLYCSVAVFLSLGAAMWAQLATGWQWADPVAPGTYAGMILISAGTAAALLAMVLAAVPVAAVVALRVVGRRGRDLLVPSAMVVAGLTVILLGAHHFQNGWPGTGGHPWAHRYMAPGRIGAFVWASTLGLTSYWMHPTSLASFPAGEIAWMTASPLAIASAVVGSVKILRRVDMPARVLRYETSLGRFAVSAMLVFVAGSSCWIVYGGSHEGLLFHAGAIDMVELVIAAGAIAAALRTLTVLHKSCTDRLVPIGD